MLVYSKSTSDNLFETSDHKMQIQYKLSEILIFAKDSGFHEVNGSDVEEQLESHSKPVTSKVLVITNKE